MASQEKGRLAVAEDVARLAGVSPSTVSRVFDPKWEGKVRESTRERIMRAAAQLGYTPNAIARSLNASRTNIIAVVAGDSVGYFFSEIFFSLMGRIQASGRQVLTFEANPALGLEHIVSQVHQYRVDAIIVLGNATSTYIEDYFSAYGTPVILVNRESRAAPVCSVRSDVQPALYEGVAFLAANGHRRLAYLSGEGHSADERERSRWLVESAKQLGVGIVHQIDGDYSYGCGFAAGQELMRRSERADAIFCADDTMALGVMDGVRSLGFGVPGDVSVMGFDDTEPGRMDAYQLTTISHERGLILDGVLDVLDRVLADAARVEERLVPMRLMKRSSVKLLG